MTTKNKFRQYRLAQIEAREITRAELEAQFETGAVRLSQCEVVIEQRLNADAKAL
jgi:hypothetical protein